MIKDMRARKMSNDRSVKSFRQLDLELGTDYSLNNIQPRGLLGSLPPYEMKNGRIEPFESTIDRTQKFISRNK